jgi:hypothetical protein
MSNGLGVLDRRPLASRLVIFPFVSLRQDGTSAARGCVCARDRAPANKAGIVHITVGGG